MKSLCRFILKTGNYRAKNAQLWQNFKYIIKQKLLIYLNVQLPFRRNRDLNEGISKDNDLKKLKFDSF